MLTIQTRPAKLLVNAATYNGLLLLGDFPYKEGALSPFSDSHAGTIDIWLRKSGANQLPGSPAFATASAVYPLRGFAHALSEGVRAVEFKELDDIVVALKPKVIIGFGTLAMQFLKHGASSLDDERGAPFKYRESICVLTYHPRDVYRQWHNNIIALLDVEKAIKYYKHGWIEPHFKINATPEFKDVILTLNKFLRDRPALSCDIETESRLRMTCIGFAWNETEAIVIPFVKNNAGERWWSFEQEKQIWPLLARVLETCPLAGQNAVHFDHYALATQHKILANFISDTMVAQWELSCEHPKSLGFIASVHDDIPYWKGVLSEARKGKRPYTDEFLYNGRDCIATLRSSVKIKADLSERPDGSLRHYRTNILLSRAFQYMSIHGMRFDNEKRKARVAQLEASVAQHELELQRIVGFELNVSSPKQMKEFLYGKLALPLRTKSVFNEETGEDEDKATADYLTLLKLAQENPNKPELLLAGRLRKEKKRLSTLRTIDTRDNGYVGYMLNVVGTETGRASSTKPLDKRGIQAQNQDRRDRDLYLPDEGYYFGKADLEGADSWTVAAMCKSCGDPTMMYDLEHGIKPAQALTIAQIFGHHLISVNASELVTYKGKLKVALAEQKERRGPGRTDYDVFKAVSHGTNYGMGPGTMQDNMFKKSDGELWVPIHEVKQFQDMYNRRYPGLKLVHERIVGLMSRTPLLTSQSGHTREFYGRKDNSTMRDMMAHLPQANTGYATNLMILRLFYGAPNQFYDGQHTYPYLLVQPLNQVHDETVFQFPMSSVERSVEILKAASQNRFSVWGIEFSIPFEAAYGSDWGNCKNEINI